MKSIHHQFNKVLSCTLRYSGLILGGVILIVATSVHANDWSNDPKATRFSVQYDLTSPQFSKQFTEKKAAGFRLVDIEAGGGKLGAVWADKNKKGWWAFRDLSGKKYKAKWQEMKDKGYYPVDIESYKVGKKQKYAGIWRKAAKGVKWSSFRNMTSSQFSEKFKTFKDKYQPLDFEAYQLSGKTRYAIIWRQNKSKQQWKLHRDIDGKAFSEHFKTYTKKGFRLVDFEAYTVGKKMRYAGIWVADASKRRTYFYRSMSELAFFNRLQQLFDDGYRLTDFERYRVGKTWKYAGIWRQNTTRPDWKYKAAVTKRIEEFREANNLPGVSVAIIKNGTMVYRKGFGYADKANKLKASGGTAYLAASVSKAIGATLALRLMEENPKRYSLFKPIRNYLPQLPPKHRYRLFDLLTHRSCVRDHKHKPGTSDNDKQFDSQIVAAATFWDDNLVCRPPALKKQYSTPAFTILGALLEHRTKKKVRDLIDIHFTKGLKLPSFRAQFPLNKNRKRSALYTLQKTTKAPDKKTNKNTQAKRINNSWKVLGGAIETSAVDLAKFGQAIADGKVLSKKMTEDMWTRIREPYGLGWIVATNGKYASHSGAFTGAGSYLRVYKDGSLTIAVMSNRRYHTAESARELTNALESIF